MKVPKTAAAMRPGGHVRRGHRDHRLAQPGALLRPERPAGPGGRAQGRSAAAVGGQLGPARAAAPGRLEAALGDAPDAGARRRRADPEAAAARAGAGGAGGPRGRCGRWRTITPAVTCSVQSTFTTGLLPGGHGCVAQRLVLPRPRRGVRCGGSRTTWSTGEKIWDAAKQRDPSLHLRQAVLVVQHVRQRRLLGDAAAAVPGRRAQAAGRLHRAVRAARRAARERFGTFPLFQFWGPRADIVCSEWIARAQPARVGHPAADADPGVPAPPRLRPAALRARITRRPSRPRAPWTRSARRCWRRPSGTARRWWCCRSTASPR